MEAGEVKWIRTKDRLPKNGQFVLAYYCGENWLDDDDCPHGQQNIVTAIFLQGKLYSGNEMGPWGPMDQSPFNKFNYAFETGDGGFWNGDQISHWKPLSKSPVKRNGEEYKRIVELKE